MTFNIITNIVKGLGLQRDAELLKTLLESAGHIVELTGINLAAPWLIDNIHPDTFHDVNIFIEVICQPIPPARENWFIPNSEWYLPEYDSGLNRMDRVLCKTKDGLNIWSSRVGAKVSYIGFEATDFFRPEIAKEKKFFHLLGNSTSKNTAAILDAWRDHRIQYPLFVVGHGLETQHLRRVTPNVTYCDRVSDEVLAGVFNACQFHIMPSQYEGYGQALHEGIGCGAVILTTDAAPMNEATGIDRRFLILVIRTERWRLAKRNFVGGAGIADAVHRAAAMTPAQIAECGRLAREGFLQDREFFRKTFLELVDRRVR